MDNKPELGGISQLGSKVTPAATPEESTLETFPITTHLLQESVVRFSCPEFTSLCPVTGQPDFAKIYIDFVPFERLVESKSLKLFLTSFRNHGTFHEACTTYIAERLRSALDPKWIRVTGIWFPRGGIPIDIWYQSGAPPVGVCIPPTITSDYSGR